MGIKAFNNGNDFVNKFVRAVVSDSTGTDASSPGAIGNTPITATGGSTSTPGNGYKYHVFNSPATFTVSSGDQQIDYLVVGGGGGGGWDRGGGGGGGAFVPGTITFATPGPYSITIGNGGAGSTATLTRGSNGGDTTFVYPTGPFVAKGGGGAGGGPGNGGTGSPTGGTSGTASGAPSADPGGGSGGGSEGSAWGTSNRGGESGTYGNPGFKWGADPGPQPYTGGGGGGAGSGGPNNTSNSDGGDGASLPWLLPGSHGVSGYLAGGGGGGGVVIGPGGSGGGGNGGSPTTAAVAGTVNTGSGGGGGAGGGDVDGRAGGSGVVILRYAV